MSVQLQSPTTAAPLDESFASGFTARVCASGDHRTVHVGGELDLSSHGVMLRACLDGNHRSVMVDLAELTFMDCTGYGALTEARDALERRGGSLTLAHAVGEPAFLLRLIDGVTLDAAHRSRTRLGHTLMPRRSAASEPSRGNLLSIGDAHRPDDEVGMSPADWLADAEVADRQRPPSARRKGRWEYLIVALAEFEGAKAEQGESEAVSRLNREGAEGWEAVGMTSLNERGFAVLLKRRLPDDIG